MSESRLFMPQNFTAENLDVTVDPATAATSVSRRVETTEDIVIPGGNYKVVVTNAGNAGGGEFATATANGFQIFTNGSIPFESYLDPVTNQHKRPGPITVVTNGAMMWIDITE